MNDDDDEVGSCFVYQPTVIQNRDMEYEGSDMMSEEQGERQMRSTRYRGEIGFRLIWLATGMFLKKQDSLVDFTKNKSDMWDSLIMKKYYLFWNIGCLCFHRV